MTFSGNNDFTVINYLFDKYGINFDFNNYFRSVDIQKIYEHTFKQGIGLKALEKKFDPERTSPSLSIPNFFSKALRPIPCLKV